MSQKGIVIVIRSENLAAVGGPTDAEFVEKIARYFYEARFD